MAQFTWGPRACPLPRCMLVMTTGRMSLCPHAAGDETGLRRGGRCLPQGWRVCPALRTFLPGEGQHCACGRELVCAEKGVPRAGGLCGFPPSLGTGYYQAGDTPIHISSPDSFCSVTFDLLLCAGLECQPFPRSFSFFF